MLVDFPICQRFGWPCDRHCDWPRCLWMVTGPPGISTSVRRVWENLPVPCLLLVFHTLKMWLQLPAVFWLPLHPAWSESGQRSSVHGLQSPSEADAIYIGHFKILLKHRKLLKTVREHWLKRWVYSKSSSQQCITQERLVTWCYFKSTLFICFANITSFVPTL